MDRLTDDRRAAGTHRSLVSDIHPRPQLARLQWMELDGDWGFAYDDDDVGIDERWMRTDAPFTRTIRVPYPPESPASGISDPGIHQVVWYRRGLELHARPGHRTLLHFGAVDYRAQVWVNGSEVAEHHGGHSPFSADITAALDDAGHQVIVVRAEDRPTLEQPRGKQHWRGAPEEIWYERTTGIWQPVWIEEVPDLHIAGVRWTPDVRERRLGLEVRVAGRLPKGLRLRVSLRGARGVVADDVYSVNDSVVRRDIGVEIGAPSIARLREILWSPEHPNLLDAELALIVDDVVVDSVQSYAGMRVAGARDRTFQLNGRPYYLRLVLLQGYWPDSYLAAPNAEALRSDVQLIKELGFNGVRLHQKAEDPRFLYWCDRLGLLVWEEMPSAYAFSASTARDVTNEWLEILERDYSHPSVVTWVPFNESWGVEWLRDKPPQAALVRALFELARAMDGTRPVICNDGWEYEQGDIIGVHDYTTDPAELRRRYATREAVEETLSRVQPNGRPIIVPGSAHGDEPVVLSEFGGVTFEPARGAEWFGYGVVGDADALTAIWQEMFSSVLDSRALAGFCYTQFADTRQETNGMVTSDRKPKVDPARIRALVRRRAAALPNESVLGAVLQRRRVKPQS